jgi:hypothetical protein
MLARYINLRNAEQRRLALEASIRTLPPGQWQLMRFEAIDKDHPTCRAMVGRATAGEKACYLSHMTLLTEMLEMDTQEPFFVWEDDVLVGYRTNEAVANFVKQTASDAWDLLYTDVVVPDLPSMLELFMRGRLLRQRNHMEVIDLRTLGFAGTTSYLVNTSSLPKIASLLAGLPNLDEPLDLLLRRWIHQGVIKGHVLFPFVTTVSDAGLSSQIASEGTAGTDLAWNLFRRLTWLEADVEQLYPLCNQLSSLHADPASSVMGVITAAQLSPRFRPK